MSKIEKIMYNRMDLHLSGEQNTEVSKLQSVWSLANFIRVLAWAKKFVKNATKLSFLFFFFSPKPTLHAAKCTCLRKFYH